MGNQSARANRVDRDPPGRAASRRLCVSIGPRRFHHARPSPRRSADVPGARLRARTSSESVPQQGERFRARPAQIQLRFTSEAYMVFEVIPMLLQQERLFGSTPDEFAKFDDFLFAAKSMFRYDTSRSL